MTYAQHLASCRLNRPTKGINGGHDMERLRAVNIAWEAGDLDDGQLPLLVLLPRLPTLDETVGPKSGPRAVSKRRLSEAQRWMWTRCPRHGNARATTIKTLGTQVCSECYLGKR